MILTGDEIQKNVLNKKIIIDPFDEKNINPNSYNFSLGSKIKVYKDYVLDPKEENLVEEFYIPECGMHLNPSILYLGHTKETMGSNYFVPIIRGRSSTGRLGIFIHITADLIDIGSINQWTLMMHVVQPVKIYPNMPIGQVTFWSVLGDISLYCGKYQGSIGPKESKIYKDFIK